MNCLENNSEQIEAMPIQLFPNVNQIMDYSMHLGNILNFNNNLLSLDNILKAQFIDRCTQESSSFCKDTEIMSTKANKFSIENLIKK